MVTQARIRNGIWPVSPVGVLRNGTVVVAVRRGGWGRWAAVERIVCAGTTADNREDLSALPTSDQICLPSGEGRLLEAGKLFSVLQFIVEREGEAILEVRVRFAIFDLTDG